VEINLTMLHS